MGCHPHVHLTKNNTLANTRQTNNLTILHSYRMR